LLKLPEELQQKLARGEISMGHARALLSMDGAPEQIALGNRIIAEGLSVREIEEIVLLGRNKKAIIKTASSKKRFQEQEDPNESVLTEKLQHRFGTKISIVRLQNQKGKIEIQFNDTADLNRIADLLLQSA